MNLHLTVLIMESLEVISSVLPNKGHTLLDSCGSLILVLVLCRIFHNTLFKTGSNTMTTQKPGLHADFSSKRWNNLWHCVAFLGLFIFPVEKRGLSCMCTVFLSLCQNLAGTWQFSSAVFYPIVMVMFFFTFSSDLLFPQFHLLMKLLCFFFFFSFISLWRTTTCEVICCFAGSAVVKL